MKVSGPGRASKSSTRKTGKTRGGSGAGGADFASRISGAQAAARSGLQPAENQPVSGAGPVAPVEALLGLQETPDAADQPSKGIALGHDILDRLEDIRRGLLLGTISATQLRTLAHLLKDRPPSFQDPGLSSILDDIELRARVELAKLERPLT